MPNDRIVVRLPELLLSRLDAEVKRLGVRRSDLVRMALAEYLDRAQARRKEDEKNGRDLRSP